jgi:mannonate dehydratase
VPVGNAWPRDRLQQLADDINAASLLLSVVESIPVHEDIKLGRPGRDRLIDNYCESVRAMGAVGIPVLCYNFMPVFDWTRTDLAMQLPTVRPHSPTMIGRFKRSISRQAPVSCLVGQRRIALEELAALLAAYREVDEERLWEHLAYFLERVVPVAEASACGWRCILTIPRGASSDFLESSVPGPTSSD